MITNRVLNLTHCPNGHEYSPDNTKINKAGHRVCRACALARSAHRVSERQKEFMLALMANDPAPPTTWRIEGKLWANGWLELHGGEVFLTEAGRLRVVEFMAEEVEFDDV